MKAHSAGLFQNGEPTVKDCSLNPEAGIRFQFGSQIAAIHAWMSNWPCKAIFAVLSVTPTERLSEQVLADGILTFFQTQQKVPAGIALSAVEGLAAKLALGLKKVASKFKRLHGASPGSKIPALTQLKKRLSEYDLSLGDDAGASPSNVESVEIVAAASVSPTAPAVTGERKVDWKAMAAKFQSFKLGAAQQSQRPVPTPARSSHMLPEYVLETLQQSTCPVEPFSTTNDAADEGGKVTLEEDDSEKKSPKKKQKTKTATKSKAKKPSKKAEIAGPQEEEGLSLAETPKEAVVPAGAAPGVSGQEAGGQPAEVKYVAKEFGKMRLRFIQEHRAATGASFKAANDVWMSSSERASYLATIPPSECKKRRFY